MSKIVNKNGYYYLKKQYLVNSKPNTKEIYLGKEIPKNIDKIRNDFDKEIRKERFEDSILKIKENFNKEFYSMPELGQKRFLENFAVKFTYNTQAIEGSTLTLMDTRLLLKDGISPQKPIKDVEETKDHHKLFFEMLEYKNDLSLDLIYFWHKRLFERSYPEIAGKNRTHNVGIAGSKSKFPDYIEVQYLMEEFIDWYKKNKNKLNIVELAALVHYKFVTIHPFSDGNGRMSRLLMNFILYKNNSPLVDISYGDRRQYYNSLEKSQINKDSNYFVEFIIKKFIKDYKEYLK